MNGYAKKSTYILWLLIPILAVFMARSWVLTNGQALENHLLSRQDAARSGLSEHVSVRAAGRGNPYVNLGDGHDLLTNYVGKTSFAETLRQDQTLPTSLTSADFDEDGVPDLVSGYSSSRGGLLTIYRGNVDSIYPNAPESKQHKSEGSFVDTPFFPSAAVFETSEAVDFLQAGDFDGDCHWDVVTAARGRALLHLFSGNGRGELTLSRSIQLPGLPTALVAGEGNRSDGLTDLAVGILGPIGSQALVFASPLGALRGEAEVFAVPAEVTGLAMGQLDDEYTMDLAVATGSELFLIHGRDQKLSLDESSRQGVLPAAITRHAFESPITSIAVGNFTDEMQTEIAVLLNDGKLHVGKTDGKGKINTKIAGSLPENWSKTSQLVRAKVSSLPHDDLVLVDQANHELHILGGEKETESIERHPISIEIDSDPIAVLPMRLNADALQDLVVLRKGANGISISLTAPLSTFVVNSSVEGSDCSVNDGICSTGTMNPQTGQCTLTNECTLRAAIQQTNANPGADAIVFSVSTVEGHNSSHVDEIVLDPVTIDGTGSPAGRVELKGFPLNIQAGSTSIRGTVINADPASPFFYDPISLSIKGGNIIEGNRLGTDVTGSTARGSRSYGMTVSTSSPNNVIGGTASPARNLISGNRLYGIVVFSSGNVVRGNFIGTDETGTVDLGNHTHGVFISSVANNTVGGTTPEARNIISGNDNHGTFITGSTATGNIVQGNYIGTDVTGTKPLGNSFHGVNIANASNNIIGGVSSIARNIISGNSQRGIGIVNGGNNTVSGNYIGIDVSGTHDLGNGLDGVIILNSSNNRIGGTAPGARNIISGNNADGVNINGNVNLATGNVVQGNFIGTDVSGTFDLGNSFDGISIVAGASNNSIGSTNALARNIISGNDSDGVEINGSTSTGNIVQGNYIGSDVTGTVDLGNLFQGVNITNAVNNLIGGPTGGAPNTISGNNGNGVQINGSTATGNQVQGNFIGLQVNGTNALPNTGHGVFITNSASNNTIGRTTSNAGNRIQNNGGDGVFVASGTGNSIRGNSIFRNAGLGIDLGSNGIAPNDSGDADSGANNLQNFPELSTSSLLSKPNSVFTIDFYSNTLCDSSGSGEGQIFIDSVSVKTDVTGKAGFSVPLPGGFDISQVLTATATDTSNNTSEFSSCAGVAVGSGDDLGIRTFKFWQVTVNYKPTISWNVVFKTPVGFPSFHKTIPVDQARVLLPGPSVVTVPNVKIELSRNGGSTFETLVASTPNDGSECWLVTGPATTQALIRISSTDNPSITGTSEQPFEIIGTGGPGALTPVDAGLGYCADLSTGDSRSPIRGSSFYADRYSFPGSVGQHVAITLGSSSLDTYVYLIGPDGSLITQGNNGGGATDARIPATSGYFTLPSTGTYVIEATSLVANALGNYQLRLDTGPLLFAELNSQRAIALDSVVMIRDPLPLVSTSNFSLDHRTRVSLFVTNLELLPGENSSDVTAHAEDSQHRVYPLTVEYVGRVPNFGWLTQINVRLPDELDHAGDVWVSTGLRGVVGNGTLINIR